MEPGRLSLSKLNAMDESAIMYTQLIHTFSCAIDIRWNQSTLNQIHTVFPCFEPLSILFLLRMAGMYPLNRKQINGLMSIGYNIVLTPGYTLYYRGDLFRDVMVIIDGYACYDTKNRADSDASCSR